MLKIEKDTVSISFDYDAMGNRIRKLVEYKNRTTNKTTATHYVRDASGNLITEFIDKRPNKYYIYGSSRLGTLDVNASRYILLRT